MKPLRLVLAAALAAALSVIIAPGTAEAAGSVSSFQQCENRFAPAPYTSCNAWINGGLNAQNAYAEDNVLPQRIVYTATDTGPNTLTVSYDDIKQGNLHGFDYLATWNLTQTAADPCLGLTGAAAAVCQGPSSTAPMASDGATRPGGLVSAHELPQAQRQWTIHGGTITDVAAITHDSTHGFASFTFQATSPGPVVILFGGHLAVGTPSTAPRSWGDGVGSHDLPGGSLSMDIGGASNSINTGAIAALPPAAFAITKTPSSTTAAPGDTVTYTVEVTNTGGTAASTSFTDDYDDNASPDLPLPAGCVDSTSDGNAQFTCTTGTIEPGASETFTYDITMPTSFTGQPAGCANGGYPVANTATLADAMSASATICVTASADFSITKSASSDTAGAGDTVGYTVEVTNNGTGPGSTSFIDDYDDAASPVLPLAPGCVDSTSNGNAQFTCTTDTIDPGDSQTFSYELTMPASFTGTPSGCANGGYPVSNGVTVGDGGATDSATVCVTAAPNFTVTKTASSETAGPGDTVTYTVDVTNDGTGPGSTSFTDDYDDAAGPVLPLPDGCVDSGGSFTCATGSLDPGDSHTVTYDITMPTAFTGPPGIGCEIVALGSYPVANLVTVATAGATDSATVCVSASPAFAITKDASSATAAAGDTVTYTVTVTNNGASPGSTSFIDDYDDAASAVLPLPTGCFDTTDGDDRQFTCTTVTLDPGEAQTFTYAITMPATFTGTPAGCTNGGFPVTNQVATTDGDADDSATVCVSTSADFSVVKTAGSATAAPGDVVTYTVEVTNNGSGPGATTFTDDYDDSAAPVLPLADGCVDSTENDNGQFTCTTSEIGPGDTQTFSYDITMPTSFTGTPAGCANGAYPVVNGVSVTDGGTDGATVCVDASPAFAVTKSVSPDDPGPGDVVTYTVTVTNNGSAPGGTTVVDDYDDRLSLGTLPSGCTDADGVVTCTVDSIAPGGSYDLVYSTTIPAAFTGESDCIADDSPGYAIDNTATVGDDESSVELCVPAAPDFTITKTVDPETALPGGTLHYTVTVHNNGDAEGSTGFVDDYDDRLAADLPVSDPDGGSCIRVTDGDEVFSCLTGAIPAHGAQTFAYDAVVPDTFAGPAGELDCNGYAITNVASLVTGGADAPVVVCIEAAPDFDVTKSANDTEAAPNDEVTYTVVVSNNGTAPGSTEFTDDFDDRLDPSVPDGCTKTTDGNLVLNCATGTIPAGESETFTYTAVIPDVLTGPSGGSGCDDGSYAITNTVIVEVGGADGSATICVPAAPRFEVAKSVDDTTGEPGQSVSYTVTVTNTGHVAGSTTFTDDHDDRLTPSVPDGCTAADGVLTCTTGTIDPGGHQDFEYTADLPETYAGESGGDPCDAGSYPVTNTVAVTTGDHGEQAEQTVCVAATPVMGLDKSVVDEVTDTGDTLLTYTIAYSNSGAAEANDVTITDAIPEGTSFVSCTGGCATTGDPVTSASWEIAPVAALTGSGSVVLVVKVTGTEACTVTNTAQLQVGSAPPISSNTVSTNVTPPTDPTDANASGSATGVRVLTAGLLDLLIGGNGSPFGYAETSQTGPGGPVLDDDALLKARVPNNGRLVQVGALTTTSASAVAPAPMAARQLSTAEVADVCLVPVNGLCTVEVDALRAVAGTTASGSTVSSTSAGSTIGRLKVAGLGVPVDLNQTTRITLNPLVFGPGSYVAINERAASSGLEGGKLVSDLTVTMIHLKITGLLGLQAAEIVVGQATAHSEFQKTFACNPNDNTVSGHAYVAGVNTGPLQTNLLQGFVGIPPSGGADAQHIVAVKLPADGSLVGAKVADSAVSGTVTSTATTSRSMAEIAGDGADPVCVLRAGATCVVTAVAIRSEARSSADGVDGSHSSDTGTTLANVQVLGLDVPVDVAPNTAITLPGIGFVVLNEQVCDNGEAATHTCSGYPHSGITVRAVHIVVTAAQNLLGLQPGVQLVVAEAHADTSFR